MAKDEKYYLDMVDSVIAEGPFDATWESLQKAQVPEWFRERHFGIFMHWGLYSVAANSNEWYSRNMYIQGMPAYEHHIKTYGPQKDFGYKDFIPMLTAEKFDPDSWMKAFKEAGAGYVFPVAEHHDGFQMYASDLSEWNAAEKGPKRDLIAELKKAAEDNGLVFCTSTHRAEHWFFMGHGKEFDSDVKEPMKKGDFYWPAMPEPDNQDLYSEPYPTEEFLDDWLARTAEIIVKYQPALLYFDWWIQHRAFKKHLKKLVAFYYNMGKKWGRDAMVCYKHDALAFGSGIVEVERGGFADSRPYSWQTDTAVAHNSWCYTDSLDYKSMEDIIFTLVDVVSKGGNLLLNVGPKADGTLPEGDLDILKNLADWMRVNGEAINGAKTWRTFAEGPTGYEEGQFKTQDLSKYTSSDYRFTCRGENIYAIALKPSPDGIYEVKTLGDNKGEGISGFHGIIQDVKILGYDGELSWDADDKRLRVEAKDFRAQLPVVIRVSVE